MNDPIKIIHKFKNINKRNQYLVYIFVGDLLPLSIKKILEKIKDLNFYDSLIKLNKREYQEMQDYYGRQWYNFFFLKNHIDKSKKIIKSSSSKRKKLISQYGKDWFNSNIEKITTDKKILSYSNKYTELKFLLNKIKLKTKRKTLDFRTYIDSDLLGGEMNVDMIDKMINKMDDEEEEIEVTDDMIEDMVTDDFDINDISNLYSNENIEKEKTIMETTKLISEVLKDKSWKEKVNKIENKYDTSLDNLIYDTRLEDTFNKFYVYNQYIFKNDTIKNIRKKVAVSIPLGEKFPFNIALPEFQYFWTEYTIDRKKDRVMLGQKWSRRNELLKIDIIPNDNLKVYENLRNNLVYLRDNFGYKLKREDDETAILRNYEDYYSNNEIFMLDIFNEIGLNYNSDKTKLKNLFDVFVSIYFPMISYEDFLNIVNLLNNKQDEKLLENFKRMFNVIKNDMLLEKNIYTTVEKNLIELRNDKKYSKNFKENSILQSIIHVNINNPKNITGTISKEKLNLYRIFDNFILSEKYPFIEFQSNDSQITYKIYEKSMDNYDSKNSIIKWFESATYGLSFRIKIRENKFLGVGLHENGRIEYKITWKEDDHATANDINKSFVYIKDLILKINKENKKVKIIEPDDDKFKYAFINTIEKFNIPEGFKIDHNDLSDFCRFFYPYIALVIEPKKRVSKKDGTKRTSKYGTYLRYKRINKYENKTRLQLRILWYLKNYEISPKNLIDEISKQFNITNELAELEIEQVKIKFSKVINRASKNTKKLKALPKSKPPGIEIDIQGRDVDNYKIRITGARNKNQLNEIVNFMHVLIYLYVQTYLYKKNKFQKIKDTLKKLNKIAKRRHKVVEYVKYESSIKDVKAITALDKKRLGFKPEKGQMQWTRNCQNSGKDKKRRPAVISGENENNLIKMGYKLNKKSGYYEKEVTITTKNKKSKVILRAAKLTDADDNSKFNYYTCDPSANNEHMYIGFLSRGNNPSDLCMPCCFKKDQLISNNKKKKSYYLKCLGNQSEDVNVEKISSKSLGDKLYILQDTNKVQEGRFIYLPPSLNRLFNTLWDNDNIIKNHYLLESKTGYFFKYTVKDNYYNFLAAMANIYDKDIDELKKIIIENLKSQDLASFYYLNNGDLAGAFKTKDDFIEYVKTSNYLEFDITGEILGLPNVLSKEGIFYYIIEKKKTIKKEKEVNYYYINCKNNENIYQLDEKRDVIILIKDGRYYFPIYRVKRDRDVDKKILLYKKFSFENRKELNNLFEELYKYYSQSCQSNLMKKITNYSNLFCKLIINNLKSTDFKVKNQIIDDRFKCRYIELEYNKQKFLLPVKPSGCSYNNKINKLKDVKLNSFIKLDNLIIILKKLEKILNLKYVPKYLIYSKLDKGIYNVKYLLLENNLLIPFIQEKISDKNIKLYKKKYKLIPKFQSLEEKIDDAISNPEFLNDRRRKEVKLNSYFYEGFNLFRLELSFYFEKNPKIKDNLIEIVRNNDLSKKEKRKSIRKILVNIINKKLDPSVKIDSKIKPFAHLLKKNPDLNEYVKSNIREYCSVLPKNKCSANPHCYWNNNNCQFQMTLDMAKSYLNRILYEILQDKIEFKELIQENDYFVSDIVNYTTYTDRPDQKIIRSNNFNIKKILGELFGIDKIPKIGKKRRLRDMNEEEEVYPELMILGNQFIQPIINNNDSIIRAYVNSLYWLTNSLYHVESRNLGYYSNLQTKITHLVKAKIIQFIIETLESSENSNIKKFLEKRFPIKSNFFESVLNKFRKNIFNTDGKIELYVLSYIFDKPIVVYNNYNKIVQLYYHGKIPIDKKNIKKFVDGKNIENNIVIKLDFEENNNIPKGIYSIYYE